MGTNRMQRAIWTNHPSLPDVLQTDLSRQISAAFHCSISVRDYGDANAVLLDVVADFRPRTSRVHSDKCNGLSLKLPGDRLDIGPTIPTTWSALFEEVQDNALPLHRIKRQRFRVKPQPWILWKLQPLLAKGRVGKYKCGDKERSKHSRLRIVDHWH